MPHARALWITGAGRAEIRDEALPARSAADVIVRTRGTGQLFLLQGSTKGFAKPVLLGTGMGIYDKAT